MSKPAPILECVLSTLDNNLSRFARPPLPNRKRFTRYKWQRLLRRNIEQDVALIATVPPADSRLTKALLKYTQGMQPDSDPKVVQDVIFQSDPEKQIKASSFADTWSAHIEQMGQRAFRPAFLRWVEEESRRQWTYRSFLLLCLMEVAKDCEELQSKIIDDRRLHENVFSVFQNSKTPHDAGLYAISWVD